MTEDVAVVGLGIHPFGRHAGVSGLEMGAHRRTRRARRRRHRLGGGRLRRRRLGLRGQRRHHRCPCSGSRASRSSTSRTAARRAARRSPRRTRCCRPGSAEVALVVGFDKHPPGAFNPLPEEWGIGSWYGETGLMLTTQFFAMKIQRYMAEHGISESTLAKVAAKAFENGSRNPNAWRRQPLSEEDVLASKMVNDPLRQYMFCSPGEGAVALVLARGARDRRAHAQARATCARWRSAPGASARSRSSARRSRSSPRRRRPRKRPRRRSSRPASGRTTSTSRSCRTPSRAPRSCISPRPGCAQHGEQEALIQSGATRIGGRLPVNTDGGCLAVRRADRGLRAAPGARGRPPAARRRRRPAGARAPPGRLHPGLRGPGRQRVHRAERLTAPPAPRPRLPSARHPCAKLHVRVAAERVASEAEPAAAVRADSGRLSTATKW